MKKRIQSLIVPVLILALTISAIIVLPVTGQDTGLIVDKLEELDSKLEGENPVLQNKVKAVIHQIESGALNGALNKLQNDVKKSIMAWVEDPEELIKLIDEIIDLIKGITPPNPDFEMTTPYPIDVVQGGSNATSITITSVNNFSAEIALSATTSAPEVTITLDPATPFLLPNATITSELMVNAAQTAASGDYIINVTGTSGTLEHSVAIPLRIIEVTLPPTPDFTITAFPATLTIEQGEAANSTITVTSLGGFSSAVNLTVMPESIADVTLSLDATQITPSPNDFATSTLRIAVDTDAPSSEHRITVTGISGTLQRSVNISLTIAIETKPPMIVSISRTPTNAPAYNETVTIRADIVDPESGIKNATLRYSIGAVQQDIPMILGAGLYEATIPAQPYSTIVEYSIQSSDNAGNAVASNITTYTVKDPYQPIIGVPTWTPQDPFVNDNVTVNVAISEPEGASGIDQVILRYSNATAEFTIIMTDNHDGNWTAVIGNQTGTKVAFAIEAVDKAGNEIESGTYEFNLTTPFPLVWILAAIAILTAATGGGALYVRRKRRKAPATASMPSTAIKPTS